MSKASKTEAKQIYRYNFDAGRMGDVEGMFISTPGAMKRLFSKPRRLAFGECLGKHSDISFNNVKAKDFKVVPSTPEVVAWFEKHVRSTGAGHPSGYLSVFCEACDCWMEDGSNCEHKPWAKAGLPGDE